MPGYTGTYSTPRIDLGVATMEYVWTREDMIAMQILRAFRTPKKEAAFPKITRETLLRPAAVKRAPRAGYSRDEWSATDQSYRCEERGHEVPLDHVTREFYASDFDAEMVSMRMALWRVLIDQEIDVATLLFDAAGTFAAANQTVLSGPWDVPGTATPIDDIVTAAEAVRQRTGLDPQTLVIGAGTVPRLIRNTQIRGSLSPTVIPTVATILAQIAALTGMERILVGKAVQNTAPENETAIVTDVWSTDFALVCRTMESDGLEEPGLGRTMVWENDSEADAVAAEEYEEPQTRSTIFRGRMHSDELVFDASYGQLITDLDT